MKHKHKLLQNMKKNRRGEISFKQIMFMFVRLLMLLIIFFSMVYVTRRHVITTNEIADTEVDILMRSLMTNRNSVIFYDKDIDRVYPYIIDASKFAKTYESKLEDVFDFGEEQLIFAAKLTLYNSKGGPYAYGGQTLQPLYINEKRFQTWLDMARTRFIGPGGATEKTKLYHINVMDNGVLKSGIIEISVVMPNT